MLFYFTLFLSFVYFKIARVHNKEEKSNAFVLLQHLLATFAIVALLSYGFLHISWYMLIGMMLLFFIMAALIITTIQLGIFIDGKPILGLSQLYKYLPLLTTTIILLSTTLWLY